MADARHAALDVRLAGEDDREELHALRHEVFVRGQGVPVTLERDAADAHAVHAVARLDGVLVATGRMVVRDGVAAVGRMAVAEAARGLGAGRAVLRVLEHAGILAGLSRVELHAQLHAAGFYDRCGYTRVGETYLEAGIVHQTMTRALPTLRAVRDADAEAVRALIWGCWAEYPGCVLDPDEDPWMRAPATSYAGWDARMWVLEGADGALLACCGAKPVGAGVVELKNLYVALQARRFGYARLLEGLVCAEARARGAHRLTLWSDTLFLDAHATYSALGWTRGPGSRDLHDLSGTTEYPFTKALA